MSEQRGLVPLRPKQVTEGDIEPLSAAEIVLLQGDLSILSAAQRVEYYAKVCESVGLNPLTKPFDYIVLNGKLTLYAKKDCTDQLRDIKGISVTKLDREQTTDTYDVTAYGRVLATGREDSSLGSVPITGLRGEALSNAKMKAETKAKRRLTLSLAGLGWLDETEVGSIASAQPVVVTDAGEVVHGGQPGLAALVRSKIDDQAVVESRAVPVTEAPPAAPEADPGAPAAPDTAPAPEAAPDGTEADYVAVAREVFASDLASAADGVIAEGSPTPGITMEQFKTMMREKGIFSATVTKVAKATFGPDAGMVADMTDQQRFVLWNAVLDDRS